MDKRTAHAYSYFHDGGDYIGCRALGKDYDCTHSLWAEVDCVKCYEQYKGEADENSLS